MTTTTDATRPDRDAACSSRESEAFERIARLRRFDKITVTASGGLLQVVVRDIHADPAKPGEAYLTGVERNTRVQVTVFQRDIRGGFHRVTEGWDL